MTRNYTYIIFLALTLILSSCSSEKIEPEIVERSSEYFPLTDDQEQLFEIYEINYTIFGSDTSHYFQEERTQVLYKDADSLYAIVTILQADSLNGSFVTTTASSMVIERNELIQNNNNERTVLIQFPISEDLAYNINAYNLNDKQEATVKALNSAVTISNFRDTTTYDNALEIELEENNNIILSINHDRIYQPNVGLVYEFDQSIDQQPGQDPIGHKTIKTRL